jgi:CheY-like chemotaxis protein
MKVQVHQDKHRQRVLLLESNHQTRSHHSILLYTNGYDVEATGNEAEAHMLCHSLRPSLVLVAARHTVARTWEVCEKLQRAYPAQRIALLYNERMQLCPLYYDGELMQQAEGPDDLIERVDAILGKAG